MAVPDFQALMLPLLQLAADGKEHGLAEARDKLASKFQLSDADLVELLPSGKQPKFSNRVAWAKTYLQQAGLLVSTRRAHFQVSARGNDVLKQPPSHINIAFLEQYPEFVAFRTPKTDAAPESPEVAPGQEEQISPEEALHSAHLKMQAGLASELLAQVKGGSPKFFEQLVLQLLLKMGYGNFREDAGHVTGKSGDEGIDGVINQDPLGLDVLYLQAKKWDGTVGRPELQKFVGALHGKLAKKGVFITTGSFSPDALAYVKHMDPRIVVIDGKRLAELMIAHDVGVSTERTYQVKRVDSEFFDETAV
jgi:restriction system protein